MATLWKKLGQYVSRYFMSDEATKETDVCDSTTGRGLHESCSEEQVNFSPSECDYIESSNSEPKYDKSHSGAISGEHVHSLHFDLKDYQPSNMENPVQEYIKDSLQYFQSNGQFTSSNEKLSEPSVEHLLLSSHQSSDSSSYIETNFPVECRPCEVHMEILSTNLVKDLSNKSSCMSAFQKTVVEDCAKSCQSAHPCVKVKKPCILHKCVQISASKRKHCKTNEYSYEKCRPCKVSLERLSSDRIKCWQSADDKRHKLDQGPLGTNLTNCLLSVKNAQLPSFVEHSGGSGSFKIQPVSMCAARKTILSRTVFKKEYQPCVVRLERLKVSQKCSSEPMPEFLVSKVEDVPLFI